MGRRAKENNYYVQGPYGTKKYKDVYVTGRWGIQKKKAGQGLYYFNHENDKPNISAYEIEQRILREIIEEENGNVL